MPLTIGYRPAKGSENEPAQQDQEQRVLINAELEVQRRPKNCSEESGRTHRARGCKCRHREDLSEELLHDLPIGGADRLKCADLVDPLTRRS